MDEEKISQSLLFAQESADLGNLFKEETPQFSEISRYKIIEELGRGGMGCVYKVFDQQMNKFLALKLILGKGQEKVVKRFILEARATAQFSHPNIVTVYDVGKDNDNYFITMDYVQGQSLKEYLKNTPLNVRQFSQLMVKISRAMMYAHEKNIVHRDLKPDNIMLDKTQEPHIMDFGLAKLTKIRGKNLTKKGAVMGTPRYMSPEQAQGKEINHLTDVYALGAIFFEMLAGSPLVQGQTVVEIMSAVIDKEPNLLRQINPALAKDLEVICHKAIAKEKRQRYQNANEFADDIERFLNGELIKAKTASLWEKCKNKLWKNKLVAIVFVSGILMVIAGVWGAKHYKNKSENAKARKHLESVRKLEEVSQKTVEQQMQMYLKVSNILEKALSISPNSLVAKKQLMQTKKTMGNLALEQKNYLLSFALFKQYKNLGGQQADELLKKLKQEKRKLKKKHKAFITKAMQEVSKKTPQSLVDRYVFSIVNIIMLPFFERKNAVRVKK